MAEAVGLTASIVTLVSLSGKILAAINDINDTSSSGALQRIQAQLPLLNESLESIRQRSLSDELARSKQEALSHAVEGCHRQAAIIHDLVCAMRPGDADSN